MCGLPRCGSRSFRSKHAGLAVGSRNAARSEEADGARLDTADERALVFTTTGKQFIGKPPSVHGAAKRAG